MQHDTAACRQQSPPSFPGRVNLGLRYKDIGWLVGLNAQVFSSQMSTYISRQETEKNVYR